MYKVILEDCILRPYKIIDAYGHRVLNFRFEHAHEAEAVAKALCDAYDNGISEGCGTEYDYE